ncbi:uncharacterized protein LOC129231851 isoform X2 [Uloborus diversus]|nr:uncharacterized protein LOC129231851 isoform X2 [Uloborus diversus]
MVEESGCRCACQGGGEEFDLPPDDPSNTSSSGCCNPKVFTTVLLGILSCVLMTGGVFLAFHRWDPMWLLVSGVGVILIFIGTIQHCCSDNSTPARRSSGKGGCCSRPPAPDHPHIVTHNGSLTEQLLPLTNARSVSQLSLNMLPGYFPPVVTAYGIEQHSAVVQNINRLVQQQQQQAPSPQSPGAPAGKSFILLSLPGENPPANLQNLVATVYQLDGSIVPETATTDTNPAPDTPVNVTTRTNNLVLKTQKFRPAICGLVHPCQMQVNFRRFPPLHLQKTLQLQNRRELP